MMLVSDLDGVICSFESAWNPLLAKLAGESKLPNGWQNDPNFPSIWDWDVAAYGKDIVSQGWTEVRKSSTFWTTLKPHGDVVELGRNLNRLHRKHQLVFLTSRCGVGVQRQSSEWLYKHLGIDYPTVIVVDRYQDKIPLLHNLGATFFVDDKLETMQEWYTHCFMNGIKTDGPNYFALIDAPYNSENRTIRGMKVATDINAALREAGLT